jgi:hypothetical protein
MANPAGFKNLRGFTEKLSVYDHLKKGVYWLYIVPEPISKNPFLETW